MTTNLEEIYGRYRTADFTDRLNIYLQFPELRNDFLEIDQQEKTIGLKTNDAAHRPVPITFHMPHLEKSDSCSDG